MLERRHEIGAAEEALQQLARRAAPPGFRTPAQRCQSLPSRPAASRNS